MSVPHYTREHQPSSGWQDYVKVVPTRMVRINGPFAVETREGPVSCQDGWLAVDSAGWPYPIDVDEHRRVYRLP